MTTIGVSLVDLYVLRGAGPELVRLEAGGLRAQDERAVGGFVVFLDDLERARAVALVNKTLGLREHGAPVLKMKAAR